MVENIGGPAFPVVFFDGEREINIGNVGINPMMDFKTFQLMISQRIGISPNQISIYLCDNRKADRKRIPITGKVNFAFIAREKDCFFLAVLKRSRKSRNRKARMNGVVLDYGEYLSDNEFVPPPPQPENLILLRRNQPALNVNMNPADPIFFGSLYYDQISQAELSGLNDRMDNLKIQRENYDMAMARSNQNQMHRMNPNPNLELDLSDFPRIQETCKECSGAKNCKTTAFHPCVHDPVIKGWFRSRVGPVRRRPKTPH